MTQLTLITIRIQNTGAYNYHYNDFKSKEKNSNDISAVQFNSHYSLVLKKPRTRNTVITWYHFFKLMDNRCMNSISIRTGSS